jgi:hypothetical protein
MTTTTTRSATSPATAPRRRLEHHGALLLDALWVWTPLGAARGLSALWAQGRAGAGR